MTPLHLWWWCSAAALFTGGILLIGRAERFQKWVLRKFDPVPFRDYVESRAYVVQVRLAGIVAIAMALFFAYAAYANK